MADFVCGLLRIRTLLICFLPSIIVALVLSCRLGAGCSILLSMASPMPGGRRTGPSSLPQTTPPPLPACPAGRPSQSGLRTQRPRASNHDPCCCRTVRVVACLWLPCDQLTGAACHRRGAVGQPILPFNCNPLHCMHACMHNTLIQPPPSTHSIHAGSSGAHHEQGAGQQGRGGQARLPTGCWFWGLHTRSKGNTVGELLFKCKKIFPKRYGGNKHCLCVVYVLFMFYGNLMYMLRELIPPHIFLGKLQCACAAV
jgi:hypothetical protein